MIINYNPSNYCVDVKRNICEHHKNNIYDNNYPGCTCSTTFTQRVKNFDEILEEIIEERGDVLEELSKL